MSAPVRIGFHPLNDCALLAVAQACGLFEAERLDVTLSREPSWSNIRDKLAYGLLEAAHILAPAPIAAALGAGGAGGARLIVPMALGAGGNSVVAMGAFAGEIGDVSGPEDAGVAVARAVRARQAAGAPPPVFGAPFPFSAHAYVLRQWLSESGLDPERDVRFVIAPPVRMEGMARQGLVDAFCVGAPWGQATVLSDGGRLLFSDQDYWPDKPEKALAVAAGWSLERPDAAQALVRALMRAAIWADEPANRADLVRILALAAYVGAAAEHIDAALHGPLSAGHRFAGSFATYPWPQHARWFARQMLRWSQTGRADAADAAERVYRPDLWRSAALETGLPAPAAGDLPPGMAAIEKRGSKTAGFD